MKLVHCTLLLLLLACKKDERATTTTTTSATTESGNIRHMTAAARISGARCDREDVCDPFGEGKRFASRTDCDHGEYGRAQSELPASACANGVDDAQLGRCLESLKKQDCALLGSKLESIDDCTPSALCMHRP
jgi:hypothetical protein